MKVTASGRDFNVALQRMDRALREFRIRGVKTNIPFLEKRHPQSRVPLGSGATTTLIDTTPELFQFAAPRSRDKVLLAFLGDVIVNGNPQSGQEIHAQGAFIDRATA